MTKINFDLITTNPAVLDGNITAQMIDQDGDSNLVIDRKAPSTLRAQVQINGAWAWLLWGTFHLRAVAESIGPGPELTLGETDVVLTLVPPIANRSWTIDVPLAPGTVPQDGSYKIVLLLTHTVELATTPPSSLRTRTAAFVEIPMVDFYTHDIP